MNVSHTFFPGFPDASFFGENILLEEVVVFFRGTGTLIILGQIYFSGGSWEHLKFPDPTVLSGVGDDVGSHLFADSAGCLKCLNFFPF